MGDDDFTRLPDLASRRLGGSVVHANDELFAERENLIKPEAPAYSTYTFGHKGQVYDGWETRRRREPGHDWAILELGTTGRIAQVIVDTAHFKGNYPDRCFLQATADASGTPEEIAAASEGWPVLLRETKLSADNIHSFLDELADIGPIRFVRLNILPDGGVSRLRLFGRIGP
jgi:allantoicase